MPAAARFGLIGCGAIGSLLDEGRTGESLTHAAAITRSARAELTCVADLEADRARECAARRGVPRWYADPLELLAEEQLDALVLAIPADGRSRVMDAVLESRIRLVWLEKPPAASVAEALKLADRCDAAGVTVAVNHLRRWAPLRDHLDSLLASGALGNLQHLRASYAKGVLNNGSHLLDLVDACIGVPGTGRVLRRIDDGRAADPTVDAEVPVTTSSGPVPMYLLGSDHRDFAIHELTILGSTGRIRITESGAELAYDVVTDDPAFTGYRRLAEADRRADLLAGMFDRAVDQLVDVLEGGDVEPACSLRDALVSFAVATDLADQARRLA